MMTQAEAEMIAYCWHYNDEYSFYNMESDLEDLVLFLNPNERGNSTFTVKKDDAIIGFFSFTQVNNHTIDIGLGMKPDLTGAGHGKNFLKAGLEFAKETYSPQKITLSVATFNQRAIKVYQKVGFQKGNTFMQNTNGGTFEFLKMVYNY